MSRLLEGLARFAVAARGVLVKRKGSTRIRNCGAAHRLAGVADAEGHSVNYFLGNVSNRIVEDIEHAMGDLQRNISCSFDAPNRLKKVNGATR